MTPRPLLCVRLARCPRDRRATRHMVEGLADRLNPYMRRILDGSEDPHDVVGELM